MSGIRRKDLMKRCILHLGMPKTASTSIQEALNANRALLQSRGWVYPEFRCPQYGHVFHCHNEPLCRLFFPGHPFHAYRDIKNKVIDPDVQKKELTRVLDTCCRNSSRLILSSEAMLLPHPLQRIKKFFAARGYKLEPVVYVRAPYSYRVSLYQSLLKFSQFNVATIVDHLRNPLVRMAVQAAMDAFQDSVRFYPFTHFTRTGTDVVRHFFSHFLEKKICDTLTGTVKNKALSWQATDLLGYIEDHSPLYREDVKNPLRKHQDINPIRQVSGDRFHFTSEQFSWFEDVLEQENTWLRNRLGPEYCDPDYSDLILPEPLLWQEESVQSLQQVFPQLTAHIQDLTNRYLKHKAVFASPALKKNALRQIRMELKDRIIYLFASQVFPVDTGRGEFVRKIHQTFAR
jgi:hypothetical protein